MPDYAKEFADISSAYEASGGDPLVLFNDRFAGLVVSHHRILFSNSISGVRIEGEETPTGARARITVAPGTIVKDPVHLCFGVIPKEGLQEIISEFEIGEGANVTFLAHCSFPNAVKVRHVMDAKIHVCRHAQMTYSETHFHGEEGGVEVLPVAKVVVEDGGVFKNLFKLVNGAAGELHLQYVAELKENAIGELDAKVYGIVAIGNCSGREVDKFEKCGLTALPAKCVAAPLVAECFANLECNVADTSLVNKYDLFILEVLKAWVDPAQKNPKTIHHQGYGSFVVDGEIIRLKSRMR